MAGSEPELPDDVKLTRRDSCENPVRSHREDSHLGPSLRDHSAMSSKHSAGERHQQHDKAYDGSASPSSNLPELLQRNYIGDFKIKLKHVALTALVRPINARGLKRVADSIERAGWLPYCTPAVMLSRDSLSDGNISKEALEGVTVRVIDGNHRLTHLKSVHPGDHRVMCNVYYEFGSKTTKIVANGKSWLYPVCAVRRFSRQGLPYSLTLILTLRKCLIHGLLYLNADWPYMLCRCVYCCAHITFCFIHSLSTFWHMFFTKY